jgi:acylphosphatase
MASRLLIHGRVQGVGFREAMRIEAERLAVTGWVRNRRDGTVEAVVAGSGDAVAQLIAWARIGPPDARVTRVEVVPETGTFRGFDRYPTA